MAKAAGDMDAGHAEYPRGKDGDLLAEVQIMVPSTLSGKERELFVTGDPGVGKTGVVEGLAERIARGDVPEGLRDRAASWLADASACGRQGEGHGRRPVSVAYDDDG